MIEENTTPESITAAPIGGILTQTGEEIAPETLELIEVPPEAPRLLLSTPLDEYSVTEGLLLLIFLLLFVKGVVSLVREVIGWL